MTIVKPSKQTRAAKVRQSRVRAFLSGLRKKGFEIAREHRGKSLAVHRTTLKPALEKAQS
ncbi:hypothetical protein [Parasphingorhabdus sp.]|uniref:hypothetical protein n=1 Tax=Parasphingorhabdus sp. TaxID=2709688 RepID=UPI003D2A3973